MHARFVFLGRSTVKSGSKRSKRMRGRDHGSGPPVAKTAAMIARLPRPLASPMPGEHCARMICSRIGFFTTALACALSFNVAAQIWETPPVAKPPSTKPLNGKSSGVGSSKAEPPAARPSSTQTATSPSKVKATGDYLVRMDADNNGKVSLVEYQDWLTYAFDNMDRNRDGVLAPDEQPGGRGKTLTRAEHRTRVADTFKRQDRNRDGVLDTKELSAPPQAK